MNHQTEEMEAKMYYAISYKDPVSLQYLIDQGASVNRRFEGMNQLSKTPLHLCCETGQVECAQILLKEGATASFQDKWLQTPLMYSVMTENHLLTRLMVSTRRGLNIRDRHGRTALHIAVTNTEDNCLQELLKGKINVDEVDELGRTALWITAGQKNCEQRIQWLIAAHCNVNICDGNEHRTPLQVAIHTGMGLAYGEILLAAGANPNISDLWGHTPLMTLIWKSLQHDTDVSVDGLKLAQLLVGAGCDVNQCALGHRWQGTALHMAVENNCYKMVQFLLSAGADPDITAGHLTPLHLAASTNNLEMAKYLLNVRCSVDIKQEVEVRRNTAMTLTPFGYALHKGHLDLAKMIVHAGYNLREERYLWAEGDTPEILLINPELWFWLQGLSQNPRRLSHLCQIALRSVLEKTTEEAVSDLPLPKSIKDAILLNNFLDSDTDESAGV